MADLLDNSTASAVGLANSVAHTFMQLSAVPIGVVIDWGSDMLLEKMRGTLAMSGDSSRRRTSVTSLADAVRVGIEISAQVVVSGLVVSTMVSYLSSLPIEFSDPSGGSIFIILLFAAQGSLKQKMKEFISYGRRAWLNAEESVIKGHVREKYKPYGETSIPVTSSHADAVANKVSMQPQLGVAYNRLLHPEM